MDKNVEDYIRAGLDATLERLRRLCAQPSVSAYGHGIHECAQLVKEMLEELGAGGHQLTDRCDSPVARQNLREGHAAFWK